MFNLRTRQLPVKNKNVDPLTASQYIITTSIQHIITSPTALDVSTLVTLKEVRTLDSLMSIAIATIKQRIISSLAFQ